MENMLGVMIDCSRNAVMSVESIKKFAGIIKKMGYNTLMLYTEDTFELDNRPLFGYMRGRYTKAELREIDDYCNELGIEVIPCMQTLAHLEGIFKWGDFAEVNDYNNILLIGEEKTYELIDDMFRNLSESFRSRKIHIGMDEAWMVGLGKYREKNGIVDRFDMINGHLNRVCEIAKKYDYKPMIWHDMFCSLAINDIMYYYEDGDYDLSRIPENEKLMPKDVSIVYWDYYKTEYKDYDRIMNICKKFNRDMIFAGGAWTWRGFSPDNDFSIKTTEPALRACKDHGIKDVIITIWGDDGAECSPYAVLPSLMYSAEAYKGNTDMDSIKAKFKEIVGADFDSFMILDKINTPGGKHNFKSHPNKYLLYNDLFTGLSDHKCTEADDEYYKELAQEIKNAADKGEYAYIFDTLEKMAEVLSVKTNLGNRTRSAYKKNDKDELKKIALDYDVVIKKLEEFHALLQKQWFIDNKPYGFDIQDIRFGGMILRIKSCRDRLLSYIAGTISEIPELSEELLEKDCCWSWGRSVSPNTISHIL